MKKISALLVANRFYFIAATLLLIAILCFLLYLPKIDGFILLNRSHSPAMDVFFRVYTNMGDGWVSVAIFLILLFTRHKLQAWEVIIGFLLSGLLVQVIKNIFPMPRPRTAMFGTVNGHFVDSLAHVGNGSFPSGHTASAFALCTILSLFARNKGLSFVYLVAAIAVAYSRVYLGQHFPQDIFGGALVGIASAMAVYLVIDNNSRLFARIRKSSVQTR